MKKLDEEFGVVILIFWFLMVFGCVGLKVVFLWLVIIRLELCESSMKVIMFLFLVCIWMVWLQKLMVMLVELVISVCSILELFWVKFLVFICRLMFLKYFLVLVMKNGRLLRLQELMLMCIGVLLLLLVDVFLVCLLLLYLVVVRLVVYSVVKKNCLYIIFFRSEVFML